jgi:hypothetical protein
MNYMTAGLTSEAIHQNHGSSHGDGEQDSG